MSDVQNEQPAADFDLNDIINSAYRQSNRIVAERLVCHAVHMHPDTIRAVYRENFDEELSPDKLDTLQLLNIRVIPDAEQPRNTVTVTAVLRTEADRE